MMKMKTKVCATAVALVACAACFAVPAEARDPSMPASQLRVWTSHGSKRLYMSAASVYDAGVQRGSVRSSRNAYLRGFRDGTSTVAYTSSRQYVVNPAPVYSEAPTYSAAPAYGYSSYSRGTGYGPAIGGYAYDGRTIDVGNNYGHNYDGDYGYNRYDVGYAPRGLMDVAVTPMVTAQPLELQGARLSYCAARYQSFDPLSGTFLADDGYRHYCR